VLHAHLGLRASHVLRVIMHFPFERNAVFRARLANLHAVLLFLFLANSHLLEVLLQLVHGFLLGLLDSRGHERRKDSRELGRKFLLGDLRGALGIGVVAWGLVGHLEFVSGLGLGLVFVYVRLVWGAQLERLLALQHRLSLVHIRVLLREGPVVAHLVVRINLRLLKGLTHALMFLALGKSIPRLVNLLSQEQLIFQLIRILSPGILD